MDWSTPFETFRKGHQWFTDAVGLTDTQASNRAYDAAQSGMGTANAQLDADTQGSFDALGRASYGRDLGRNLDIYGQQMQGAMDQTQQAGDLSLGEMDAGSADNVADFVNPKTDMMLSQTMQKVQGGAGSALQSSAATRNASNAVANKAGEIWDTAYNQAIQNSQNNQQAITGYGKSAGQFANMAQQNLDSQNQPALDWINLNNDRAMTRYGGNVGLSQAATTAAGQSQAII